VTERRTMRQLGETPMFMRLIIYAVLLCLTVIPVAAEIDPQSLVGVWEGTYEVRRQQGGGPASGSITLTISKVEDGKVYVRSETIGARANPPVNYVSNLTPTGYSHTTPTGHASTTVVEGDNMRLTTTTATGAPMTANLVKKK
jgi:hypothetical protein